MKARNEHENGVHSAVQITLLVLSAISVILSAVRLMLDIFGDRHCDESDKCYDYDPSDIYDDYDDDEPAF